MSTSRKILVMAGGTGGHVYPGLAVADALRQRGHLVEWMGTRRGLEARVVPAAGLVLHVIGISGLRGNGLQGWLSAPHRLLKALFEAFVIMRKVKPDAVLGMGGFASGPGGLAAFLMRTPLVVHEQNAIPGLTNRVLSRLAARVLAAFPNAFPTRLDVEVTGNPVRDSLFRIEPREKNDERATLLIVGGSQGAAALNRLVPAALGMLTADERPVVTHQCGERHVDEAKAAYCEAGVEVELTAYLEDMERAYANADLVLCRSGAMTVCEVAAAGRAAVFIPFPHAVDDHQAANANYLVSADAARMVRESELDADSLAALLRSLLASPESLVEMGRRARALAWPNAATRVSDVCLEVTHA
jgi:UDP-N-acetylglucosamine--N-acetylmuramyl-(pentapeptide) pyrophosphoryl-undecaprenol N-acetylglucosamine transferase